jgi:hypothetical protein
MVYMLDIRRGVGRNRESQSMRSAEQTAILLAAILNRSGQGRARVSAKTIKILAERQNLRGAFAAEVIDALAEYSWILFELGGGGFGAIQAKALEAAKPVTAKRWLSADERRELRRGTADLTVFEREANPEQEQEVSDDE